MRRSHIYHLFPLIYDELDKVERILLCEMKKLKDEDDSDELMMKRSAPAFIYTHVRALISALLVAGLTASGLTRCANTFARLASSGEQFSNMENEIEGFVTLLIYIVIHSCHIHVLSAILSISISVLLICEYKKEFKDSPPFSSPQHEARFSLRDESS